MSSYLLKFKVNTAVDDAFLSCASFDGAVDEVFENANELDWALELSGISGSINSKDMTRHVIDAVNDRMLGVEDDACGHWSREKIRAYYRHRM